MRKHLGPIALSAALLGLVAGGVYAGSQAFAPAEPSKPAVELVQPAAQTVEPSPTTTVAPSPTATVAPKPVESTTSATSAPKVVQKKVTVAEPSTSEPAPTSTVGEVVTNPDGSTTIVMKPGQRPPVIPAKTPPPPPSS